MFRVPIRYKPAAGAALLAFLSSTASAGPVLSAVSSQTIVEAFAANTFLDPGVARTTAGGGALTDSASRSYLGNQAESSATVDDLGLHAVVSVLNGEGGGITGSARGIPSIVDPFMLVPEAGFAGTHALVEFHYRLTGLATDSGDCPSCFSAIQARLDVDGLGQSFFFLGARSEGTQASPTYLGGPLDMSGVLIGLLPVNTELFLRATLLAQTHCQSFAGAPCATDAHADFWFSGLSGDAVDFVWGFEPRTPDAPAVGEPGSLILLGLGLTALARRRARS